MPAAYADPRPGGITGAAFHTVWILCGNFDRDNAPPAGRVEDGEA
jgi:hypothetical protein